MHRRGGADGIRLEHHRLDVDLEHIGDDQPQPVTDRPQPVADLLLHWMRHPEIVRTQAELALEAARRPELMDVFDPWRQGLVRVVEELVRCAGRDDPALRAAVGVAAIEGVLATAVRMPTGRRPAFVRAAVPLVVRGLHVTG